MSDPVAEAAAALAKQQSEPSMLEKAMDTIHDLEAKVEHLIHHESEVTAGTMISGHPETFVPNAMPGSPAIADSAKLLDASGMPIETASSAKPSDTSSTQTPEPASAIASSEPSATTQTSLAESESPNVLPASTSGTLPESEPNAITGSIVSSESDEVPNAVSGAAESTTGTASAQPASGSGETSSIEENFVDDRPLHVRVADHLEAIFGMVKAHVDGVHEAATTDTSALKTHVGDILHRLSNGMAVSEGELVQKLESLYRML